MGEATVTPKALQNAMLKALPIVFPSLLGSTNNPHIDFYDQFHRVADDHDRDFVKKYDEDLNTTLIFAGLFSAVTSAFIIDVQTNLQPDYEQMSFQLLTIVANVSLGNVPTGNNAVLPQWAGPDPAVVRVQAILYSSLSASLLAALIAMLGKQWLNRYASAGRGSIVDRGRQRKRKMEGMDTWKFDLVMESLPLMLQAALLLLGYALSDYLYFINRVVASVVIGFTAFGLLFYFLITSAGTLSFNCPFQTPLSLALRYMIHFDDEHRKYLKRFGKWLCRCLQWFRSGKFGTLNEDISSLHIELTMANPHDQPPPIFRMEIDWEAYRFDSNSIDWTLGMSLDMDVTMATARVIPEIVWHTGVRAVSLERFYDVLLECFDRSSRYPTVKPGFRNMAYLSAKALVHMVIQRKCIGDGSERAVLEAISRRHQPVGFGHYEGDSDLESTLGIIDRVFGDCESSMDWQSFSFTIPHHTWMSHILPYHTWNVLRDGGALPDDAKQFVIHSLQLEPPPPAQIVADCLFIIGLLLGIRLHPYDLLVVDKSHDSSSQIARIYEKLTETFRSAIPATSEIDRALDAMELIAPICKNGIAKKSYELFHVIMQTPVSFVCSQEQKWRASRLALHSAYNWDGFLLPWVGDPQDILIFLDHHFDLATRDRQNQDEPIQNALRALAYASSPVTVEVLRRLDPTRPSFIRGICYAFQNDRPSRLRKAALLFLPLIGDRWFNTLRPIMGRDRMRSLCVDWASAVDSIEHTPEIQKVILAALFGMINSPHWRPHIVTNKWKLLEYFISVPDDSRPLRRCIDNPELIYAILKTADPTVVVLWLEILWFKYDELVPQVQEQLETVMKEARGERRESLGMYLSAMDSELEKAKDALKEYDGRSTHPAAITLRTKIYNIQQARVSFITLTEKSMRNHHRS